jgi:hypothetical protein
VHRFPNLRWRIWRTAKYLPAGFVISPPTSEFFGLWQTVAVRRPFNKIPSTLSNTKLKLDWRAIQVRGRGGLYGRVGGSRPGPGEQNGVARGPVGG